MKNLNLQAGQTWLMENGSTTKIMFVAPEIVVFSSDGFVYSGDGVCDGFPGRNLVSLCESREDAQEQVVNDVVDALMRGIFTKSTPGTNSHNTPCEVDATGFGLNQHAANDATVGDINSTAKGSGARFNSGKPAYDLVPLQMMADWYALVEDLSTDPEFDPILALSVLGEFQAGGAPDELMTALQYLGDGWEDCALVFEYGRKKYSAWNWSRGMAWSIPIACAARHLLAMIKGEELDPESGLPHRGHVYCNLAMLYTYCETYPEGDDRPPAGSLSESRDCDWCADQQLQSNKL